MRRWQTLVAPVSVVLSVLAFAGCVARTGGQPVAGGAGPSAPPPVSGAAVLGDLTTIDPCGLIDLSVFATLGAAEFAPPESLDYCAVLVTTDEPSEILVTVGQLGWLAETPELAGSLTEDVDDGIYVAEREASQNYCAQALVFEADGITLDVTAMVNLGAVSACPAVVAAIAEVVDVVRADAVEHRAPAPESLGRLDPCALVADETVTALPGFAAARRQDSPGRHQCYWRTSEGDDRLSVRVIFGVGPPPTPIGTDSNAASVAGRDSVVSRDSSVGASSYCWVETGHIPFDEVDGHPGAVELAGVYVRTPASEQQDLGCQAAMAVAVALWPELPTP